MEIYILLPFLNFKIIYSNEYQKNKNYSFFQNVIQITGNFQKGLKFNIGYNYAF